MSQPLVAAVCCLLAVVACSLDRSQKNACTSDRDCLSGAVCFQQSCTAASAIPPQASGAGAAEGGGAGNAEAAGSAGDPGSSAEAGSAPAQAGSGAVEHAAVLTSLSVSAGALTPAFDPHVHDYVLDLPLMVASLRFGLVAERDVALSLDGSPLGNGVASAAVELEAMGRSFELGASCAGLASRYRVNVRRGGRPVRTGLVRASEISPGNIFGVGLAIDGDTLAVGSIGFVEIYRRSAGTWQHEARLYGAGSEQKDNFGTSLALSGDTLVVGAPFEDSAFAGDRQDNSLPSSGAVYVFERTGQLWRERSYLKASQPSYAASFGSSVGLVGDTLAVGAPHDCVNPSRADASLPCVGAGSVSLFTRVDHAWLPQALLTASVLRPAAFFGESLALTEHGLAVGAESESLVRGVEEEMLGAGAVYIFSESGGVWNETARLEASHPSSNASFGRSVAFDGQILVIGAPHESRVAPRLDELGEAESIEGSGAVYVFERAEQGFRARAFLKASPPRFGEAFGWTVGLSERTVAVGAYAEGRFDGSAYVFAPNGASWLQRLTVNARAVRGADFKSELVDSFGWSLALSRDTLVVGAPYEGKPGVDPHGTGYLFE